MPIYEYRCTSCNRTVEVIQKFSDAPLTKCESCSGKLEKQVSRTSFHLKGGGWFGSGYGASTSSSPDKDSATDGSKEGTKESSKDATKDKESPGGGTPAASTSSSSGGCGSGSCGCAG